MSPEPEYAKRADEMSGKAGHSREALARKLRAVRAAYRGLQHAYNEREKHAVTNATRAKAARDYLDDARSLFGEEIVMLKNRLERKDACIEEHERKARQWWRGPWWFTIGALIGAFATRIYVG